ncbi:MAG: nucleotidyl transferase AbiEii/AbiGii toxin family protein [Actinomycetota bacterium]|nr:nucleotidyl transferase AbiEii/AbiGii toxin family protein [Actinomycetota bacterium]
MLSPLQERVAHIVVELAESDDFALAGGAALIVRGEVDRRTHDLDFFGPSAAAVDRLVPAAEQALVSHGLQVTRVIDHPGFARLLVSGGDEQTEVDFGSDARLFPVEERLGIRVLSGEELAVDKLLALFEAHFEALQVAVSTWKERALDYARERERSRSISHDHGPDLGFGR